ncbi:hypothetical protein [Candidatus Albibeggiatoa sp. nov. NOAA]|uniref:hypothetical protein n=1 Tax=Candidatus Albibeggiatoa sp. nov. NOAA TaxID=3162724 RepID=UPI0032F53377|nr:hypothetical protein [Thiotrichaceae bacterium]
MINNFKIPIIRLFVFGTLRVGGRLDYYMEGSSPLGLYYTQGQLMESEIGSAYIDFNEKTAATIGELHQVNYYCLQRIHHLENASGEFPRRYELDLVPIWPYQPYLDKDQPEDIPFNEDQQMMALCYRRREDSKVPSGDWTKVKRVMTELGDFLRTETDITLYHHDVVQHISEYLKS